MWALALLHNIQTYENERILIKKKNSFALPYLKCVLHLSCVVHGSIYCRFMGCNI